MRTLSNECAPLPAPRNSKPMLIPLLSVSEIPMAGPFTFHELALMVSAATALLSMFISFYLIWMHALNYTKPEEQK